MKLSLSQKLILLFLLITSSFAIIVSCKKLDERFERPQAKVDHAKKFLEMPANAPSVIKRIAESIKKQNEQTHFLDWFATKFGYPVWDKSPIYLPPANSGGRAAHAEDSLVFIPLLKEGIDQVFTFLACKVEEDSVKIRLFRGDQYGGYGKGMLNLETLSSDFVAFHCMVLENLLFGHHTFRVNDNNIFRVPDSSTFNESRFVYIKAVYHSTKERRGNIGGRAMDYMVPITTTYCVEGGVEGFYGAHIATPIGAASYSRKHTVCFNVVEWFLIIESGGSGTTVTIPNGEGGGGGGNWYDESPCRTPLPGQSNCGDDPSQGWMPVDDVGDYFDDYENWGYKHFETWDVTPEDWMKINNWKNNNIDTTGLDSCRRVILRKLLGNVSGNNPLGKILAKMDKSIFETNNIEKLIWNLNFSNLGPGTVAQLDSFSYNPSNGLFTAFTLIDSSKITTATDIYVAGIILHEAIHAYMMSVLYRVKNGVTLAQLQSMTYDSLFNEYIDTLTARNASTLTAQSFPGAYHHNLMQRKLLDAIAEALKLFDNNRINDDEYYWYIAWKGLSDTDAWRQHWPNYNDPINIPILGAPYTTDDSTRGMTYALTPTRIVNINRAIGHERQSDSLARGLKPVNGGCY